MKVYVAAPYPARKYVESVFVKLAQAGHECTSTWALGTRDIHVGTVGASPDTEHEDLVRHVKGDLFDVARSDALIELTANYLALSGYVDPDVPPSWLHTGGRHVEFGYAMGEPAVRKLIVVGEPENVFQRGFATIVPNLSVAIHALG